MVEESCEYQTFEGIMIFSASISTCSVRDLANHAELNIKSFHPIRRQVKDSTLSKCPSISTLGTGVRSWVGNEDMHHDVEISLISPSISILIRGKRRTLGGPSRDSLSSIWSS